MGSSSSQTPVTQQTTQTRDPWAAAQPHLTAIMNAADQVFAGVGPYSNIAGNTGGYTPWPGQTQADLNFMLGPAIGQMAVAADLQGPYGGPGLAAGQGLAQNVMNAQGITPGIQGAIGGLGDVAGKYNQLYNQASGQQNPYLQAILETNNRRIGDRVNASMSGAGRYGSGAHTDVMARALAESADPILAQDYQQRQQQMMAAAQGLGGVFGQQAGIYNTGLQNAGKFAELIPTLNQAAYLPSSVKLGLGQYLQDRSQQQLADQIKLYNAQQAYPWEQLARYQAIIGGAGGLGGTQVTSSPGATQPSTLQRILGGGLAGAGLGSTFGPVGAGVGAIGGGLLGLL